MTQVGCRMSEQNTRKLVKPLATKGQNYFMNYIEHYYVIASNKSIFDHSVEVILSLLNTLKRILRNYSVTTIEPLCT